jgi:hypothetical protein
VGQRVDAAARLAVGVSVAVLVHAARAAASEGDDRDQRDKGYRAIAMLAKMAHPEKQHSLSCETGQHALGLAAAACDEHVLPAFVVRWRALEVAVERLELEPRDVDEAEPLILRCPPERTGGAGLECDVDAVVGD